MSDARRTKAERLAELEALRRQVAEWQARASGGEASAEALHEDRERLFDAMGDALLVVRVSDGQILHANRRSQEILAEPELRLSGRAIYDLMPAEARPRAQAIIRTAVEGNLLIPPHDVQYQRSDGQTVSVRISGGIVDSRSTALICIRDITESRETRRLLEEVQERYRLVFESALDPIFVFGRDGRFVATNIAADRYMHCEPGQLVGKTMFEVFPPPVADRQWARVKRIFDTGEPLFSEEQESVTPRGAFWFNTTLSPVKDGEGQVQYVIGIARDITDRKRAEAALRQSEARYRAVVECQTEFVCRFRPDGILTFVNEAVCRFTGEDRNNLIGHSFLTYLVEPARLHLLNQLARVTPDQPVVEDENSSVVLGQTRLVHWINRGIFDEQGRLVEFQATGRDITEQRAAEEALRRSEEMYRSLFEQNLDGVIVLVDGRVASANLAFAAMHRWKLEDCIGRPATEFMHPDDWAVAAERMARALSGQTLQPPDQQCRDVRSDGTTVLVEARSKRIDWAGKPAAQVILRDITERARMEEELREAQKMESVGQLAGGIAHDFNNLMTGILCHASLLKLTGTPGDDVRDSADIIEGAARRAAELTSQLLGFARRGKHLDMAVDLNTTTQAVIRLMSRSLDAKVRVHLDLHDGGAWAQGDPVQMEQVILNLAMNARDAMPKGGDLTFSTDVVDMDEEACASCPRAKPGRHALLRVIDTGQGIPAELLDRVFEPFFTTKPHGRGTGMGLAMVYGISRNHGGWVDVSSTVGRGTTFRVYWPVAEVPPAAEPTVGRPAGPRQTGRILVVDDEDLVRNVVVRMLSGMGHTVVSASDGREAVDYYAHHGGSVDLVIIDMIMPEMDGQECFRTLRQLNPNVKAILSTGWGSDGSVQGVLDEGMIDFVQKPYQMEQLAAAVDRALRE